jgi:hypothetical protein
VRALVLLVVPIVVAAAVGPATGAVKTRECTGLQVCVPVAGPWVVVPTAGASARPQTSFVLSCPKGYIVGGSDAELSSRALDVSFDARLGAPVNPGVSTTRDAVFRATKTDGTAGRVSFRPHIGCMPTAGGGGPRPRTRVSFGLAATTAAAAAVYPPGQAPALRVKTVVLRPGATQHAVAVCAHGERLVTGTHAYGFFADAPPAAALAARVTTTLAIAGRRAVLTVHNTLRPGPRAIAQVVATCAGGGA